MKRPTRPHIEHRPETPLVRPVAPLATNWNIVAVRRMLADAFKDRGDVTFPDVMHCRIRSREEH